MQENRSDIFRGLNIFIAWGNPECPWKRFACLILFGFDLQITESSPETVTRAAFLWKASCCFSNSPGPSCFSIELADLHFPNKNLLVEGFWSHCNPLLELRSSDSLATWIGAISNNDGYMQCEMHVAHHRLQWLEVQSKNPLVLMWA